MSSRLRARRNYGLLKPYLQGKILDIGAGNCLISELISKECNVSCVDIADNNKTSLPLVLYDGNKLPFKKKSFDTSLLLYVLHHDKNPENLLREAVRVTRKRIIVFEDLYNNGLELLLLKILDLSNKITSRDVPIPFNFKKEKEWLRLFSGYGKVKTEDIPMVLPRNQKKFIIDLKK